MKIKMNIEFISFNDGVCNIYFINEEGKKLYKYVNLGFSDRVLGFKRYFAARANQTQINRVIRIPQLKNIDNYDYVEINKVKYEIKLIQAIDDTNPKCIDLTLNKVR